MNKIVLWMIVVALLGGCAAPRYQSLYRYHPPDDVAGRACLVDCEQSLHSCYDDCGESYRACVQALEPEAQSRYRDAQARYAGEQAQYQRDLQRYYLSLSVGWGFDDGYGAAWYAPHWPYRGYRSYYDAPLPPQPPSYADELGKLRAQACERDCACQPKYDACFLGCGGSKTLEQRCFANCPPSQ